MGGYIARIGDGVWSDQGVSFQARRVERVDGDAFAVSLHELGLSVHDRGDSSANLHLRGRARTAQLGVDGPSLQPGKQRSELEEAAVDLSRRAEQGGADPLLVANELGHLLTRQGRHAEALPLLERAEPLGGGNWLYWILRGECLLELDRSRESLECLLGALVFAGTRADVLRHVLGNARSLERQHSSLVAATYLALSRLLPNGAVELRQRATELVSSLGDIQRHDSDLAAYVMVRSGATLPEVPPDRPRALLALAAAGDFQARQGLAAAAREDAVVRHLALLDPDLAPLVTGD